ncbi:NAD-dependent epimerase/dehydratase [Methanolobus psychrophilus R15]|nr:NAD-dependent epimerase/dehydratase [Methanolobus psychrophilus R15]
MKAIIFGINGQDGYYLTQLLTLNRVDVIGVSRSHGYIKGDVADYSFVESIIKHHQPDYVFHFAANSTTAHSALFDNHNAISTGTLNILECVRLHCPKTKVFLSGSAMQFKNEGVPIDEQTPFEANSAYSVARIQSVYAGRYYRSAFGLQVYVGYFFNHDSPLRSERHVNQKIVSAVKRIANGSSEKLKLGNIDVKKEFNYAGDVVEAVWILINQDTVFEAMIGSGIAHSIREWVEYCFKKVNKNWEEHVIINHEFVPEYEMLVSNSELIRSIGWKQKVDFYKLADMMMETQ